MQTPKIPQILISFVRLLSHTAVQMWQCGTPHLEKPLMNHITIWQLKSSIFFLLRRIGCGRCSLNDLYSYIIFSINMCSSQTVFPSFILCSSIGWGLYPSRTLSIVSMFVHKQIPIFGIGKRRLNATKDLLNPFPKRIQVS